MLNSNALYEILKFGSYNIGLGVCSEGEFGHIQCHLATIFLLFVQQDNVSLH